MLIDILKPTQGGLRHADQISSMVDFVRSGGIFCQESLLQFAQSNGYKPEKLIQINRFENGSHAIHDGHHRCLSIWLAGRESLNPKEFVFSYWSYKQYGEINFSNGYVTPYNPLEEIRHADFFDFKSEVIKIAEYSVEKAIEFIKINRSRYCEPRTCWHIKDLAPICLQEAERCNNDVCKELQQEEDRSECPNSW